MTPEPKKKPFPWRCPNCSKRAVEPAIVPYHGEVKHDGRVHNVEIPALQVPKCRTCGELVFDNRADEQVIAALRAQLRLLTPVQLRSRREQLRLSQRALALQLGVAPETISRWESGTLVQSRAMDNLLRVFFAFDDVRDALVGDAQPPDLGIGEHLPPHDSRTAKRDRSLSLRLQTMAEELETIPDEKRTRLLDNIEATVKLVVEGQ